MIDHIGNRCTGCYACVSVCPQSCIVMRENKEGFWYPKVDTQRCVKCGLCEKTCPVLHKMPNSKTAADIKVYALIHRDDDIRKTSSSGGAFSAFASCVLAQGGVVFGAAFDEKFNVKHIAITEEEDLPKLRGSKYVQSKIGDCFVQAKKYLDNGRLVLFSGTACQTAGLISFLGRDYPNLVTQDLICHGVPSPMAWRKYIKLREQQAKAKTESVFFRDKTFGWHRWHVAFSFEDGTEYKQSQFTDMMIVSYLRGKCSRLCCYNCMFKDKYRQADITLADFWGAEKIMPQIDDDRGISVCFINSPKAQTLLKQISDSVNIFEVDLEDAVTNNLAMVESEKLHPDRTRFLKALRRSSFDLVAGSFNDEIGMGTKLRWTVRRILGNQRYDALFHKKTRKGEN